MTTTVNFALYISSKYSSKSWDIDFENMIKDIDVYSLGMIIPYLFYKNNLLYSIKDSKILIVGAGPSTNEVKWYNLEYDYIFSCNHFFLNEKIFQD